MPSLNQSGGRSETDEKKRKRMISNRESARRSRMRKQKLVQDLTEEMGRLEVENNDIKCKIDGMTEKCMIFSGENNILRAQVNELSERLKSLNDVIKIYELLRDDDDDTHQAPYDPPPTMVMRPWQLPCSVQSTINASSSSSGLFQI